MICANPGPLGQRGDCDRRGRDGGGFGTKNRVAQRYRNPAMLPEEGEFLFRPAALWADSQKYRFTHGMRLQSVTQLYFALRFREQNSNGSGFSHRVLHFDCLTDLRDRWSPRLFGGLLHDSPPPFRTLGGGCRKVG